ncbi:uncharacterized protein LOC142988312 isoform X2 [Genypterus blacodes]|uniref:uncharacterized protein LOC142988312 isoform X2 n=1 Tax=Genypterus blacodes TaxID=154954 RepID=UPI003F7755CB
MDVTPQGCDVSGSAKKSPDQSECVTSQPAANGALPQHDTDKAPPPGSDRPEDSNIGDDCSMETTHDVARLVSDQTPRGNEAAERSLVPPVRTPPSPSTLPLPPCHSASCNRHSSSLPHHHHHHPHRQTNPKRLSSTQSHASLKPDAAHIKEVAGDDCCPHCLLACLFCELLSICSVLGEYLACGGGGAGCCDATDGCCCVEAVGEAACTEEACQAVLGCGILEDCCGSSDCLEICLECCSICFPS